MRHAEATLHISVILPVYNELDNVDPMFAELSAVLESTARSYEIIFVDDGSTDGSRQRLDAIAERAPGVRVIAFKKNFGQTAALAAGFHVCRGEVVVTMDADLQNDPADIPKLLAKLDDGFDVVSGWRKDRQDTMLTRRIPSVIANRLIRWSTGVKIHDYGCMLKAFRGDVARDLRLYGEMHRFIPALASDMGAAVTEVVVNHRARVSGVSKYGISRTFRVVLDLMTVRFLSRFATRPLHVFGFAGLVLSGVGLAGIGWLILQKLGAGAQIGGRPLLFLSILLVITGVQLVTMGLLAELLVRTYHESQSKPTYVIDETAVRDRK